MRLRQWIKFGWLAFWLILSIPKEALADPTVWRTVQPGLEYARIGGFTGFPNGYIHAFRVDLKRFSFSSVKTQANLQSRGYSLPALLQQKGAVLATNGGFFTPDFQPLGLRISEGKQYSDTWPTAWWGVFYIAQGQAHIVSKNGYAPNPNMNFALQVGPRLLVDGSIPQLKPDIDYRTALGITAQGQVIVLATENVLLSTGQLAEIMRKKGSLGGLDCVNAINLDGGHSTQLYARSGDLTVQVQSYAPVADVVLVTPQQSVQ